MQRDDFYRLIREELLAGKFPADTPMPSGRQMAEKHGTNKDCANSVLGALEAEGLIRRDKGYRFPVVRHRSEDRVIAIEHVSHRGAHPFYAGFNEGMLDVLISQQYGVQYFTHSDEENNTPVCRGQVISSLLEREILKGVVFPHYNRPTFEDIQVFRERNVAVTSIERERRPGAVVLDMEEAALHATHYLLSLDHSPVGLIYSQAFQVGLRGYRLALKLENRIGDEDIIDCPFQWNGRVEAQTEPFNIAQGENYDRVIQSAYEAVSRRIKQGNMPRGIYIVDEFLAIGALRAIRGAGLRIPNDIAVVSHSSNDYWEFELGGLTAMRFDGYASGVEAGRFIVEIAEGKRPADDQLILQATLRKGASCGEKQAANSSQEWQAQLSNWMGASLD